MSDEDDPKTACAEASLLFHIYLKCLDKLHEAMDQMESAQSSGVEVASVQRNLDLAYTAARDSRRAYFQHRDKHGCRP